MSAPATPDAIDALPVASGAQTAPPVEALVDPRRLSGLVDGRIAAVEVRRETSRTVGLTWRGDRTVLPSLAVGGGERCSARVHGGSGVSFAADTGGDVEEMLGLAVRRLDLTGARRPRPAPADPVTGAFTGLSGRDPAGVDLDEKIALLRACHLAACRAHPAISGALVHYGETARDSVVQTGHGSLARLRAHDASLQITIYAGHGTDLASGSVSIGTGGDFTVFLDLEEAIADAAAVAVDTLRAPVVDPGPYDVVCDGALAGTWVHETIGHLAEADHHLGDPDLVATLAPGGQVGSPLLDVRDHPGRPGARGYTPVDDEGVRGVPVDLLREGRIVTPRLHDRTTAGAFGEAVTGNARALDAAHVPLPRLRTLEVTAGTGSRDDLAAEMGRGLIAEGFHGGQTDRRGFSFTPAVVRRVVDGRIGPIVRGAVLTGDTVGGLARIDAVGGTTWRGDTSAGCGKHGQWPLPVSSWSPPIRLRGIHVQTG